jgi:hypothetical protein
MSNVGDRVFTNPYFYSSTVLAKICVNLATLIWSAIVLYKPNALATTSYGYVLDWFNEDVVAMLYMAVSLAHFVCLLAHGRPRWYSYLGYFAMMLGWGAVWMAVLMHTGPIQPTSLSASTVIFFLSVYAFIAMPKGYVCNARV